MPSEADDSKLKDEEEPSVGAALPQPVKDESESPKDETQITVTPKMETKEDQTVAAPLEVSQVSATEKVSWLHSKIQIGFEMVLTLIIFSFFQVTNEANGSKSEAEGSSMLGAPLQVTQDRPAVETLTESVRQADDNADKAEQDEGMVGAPLQTPVTENVIFIENSRKLNFINLISFYSNFAGCN